MNHGIAVEASGYPPDDANEGAPAPADQLGAGDLMAALMADAMSEIQAGNIRPKNVSDAMRIIKTDSDLQRARMLTKEAESANRGVDDAFRHLGYIMDAIKEQTRIFGLPDEFLDAVVLAAWERGLDRKLVDISEVPIYQTDYVETDMSEAAEMLKERRRQREAAANAAAAPSGPTSPDVAAHLTVTSSEVGPDDPDVPPV